MFRTSMNLPDLLQEFDRVRQDMDRVFEPWGRPASIRALARGSFPLVNVRSDADAMYVDVHVPGVSPDSLQVSIDERVLTVSGTRAEQVPSKGVYLQERFTGDFSRSVTLPDDVATDQVEASCRDGVLRIRIARREEAKPRRIEIK